MPRPRIGVRGWFGVGRGMVRGFTDDNLLDLAAALTYWGVLSLFPGLILAVSLVGLAGLSGQQTLIDNVRQFAPGPARDTLIQLIENLEGTAPTAAPLAVISIAVALWSASRYVASLIRSLNAVWGIPEGRPVWKLAPLRLALTLAMVVLLGVSAVAVTFTGRFAEQAGRFLGLTDAFVAGWNVLKWPVLLLIVIVAIATLYWAAPNVRQRGWRWITPGVVFAVVSWIVASIGFAVYVASFGAFNRTYGALATVVVFLVWLWVSNLAILLGAEFDAELATARRKALGRTTGTDIPIVPRDTSRLDDAQIPDR
ncbi:YihY/virulence factor BrkB family protein [Actinomadura flavalba]|uniref:YihY/virulence factor BrkB family protein n=1 Tax=Actinomadura flavalba TaxID=1120938 RepID=UPI001F0A5D43|nr:YihY/virulence factor BrkB family protein [Actinomadura flavalba]